MNKTLVYKLKHYQMDSVRKGLDVIKYTTSLGVGQYEKASKF